jgi:L-lactate dehydrogenase (cytochrome)
MLGRAPHWGAAAFGQRGVDHVVHVLRAGMVADMGQLGLARLPDIIGRPAIQTDTNER